jgi:hypothetical protein
VARVDSGVLAAAGVFTLAEPELAAAVAALVAVGVVLVLPAELAGAWLAAETVELRAQAGLDKNRESGWTRRNVVERDPNVRISTSLVTIGQ